MAGRGINVYATQDDLDWLRDHSERPRDVWRTGMAVLQTRAELNAEGLAARSAADPQTAVTKVGTAKRPPSGTAREQCPHRNWGRYCSPCRRNITQSGYPV